MQHKLPQVDSSKKKTVAVVLLAVVFILVVSSRFASEPAAPTATTPTMQLQPVSVATTVANSKGTTDSEPVQPLPKIDLARIVANNPFFDASNLQQSKQPPSASLGDGKQISSTSVEGTSSKDSQPKVEAVVTGGRKPAALINDTLYFERDVVDQRWVVEEILPQTVIFKPLEAKASKP